ncbi:MAG: non-canonical purine NTP pyrophosphatase [Patescibacteria group bacterium]|nr:non-canonical purine NTP pyrophosphatase [Patescibacteria group bacterium]
MKILIGTNNQNKYKEYKRILNIYAPEFEIIGLTEAKISDDIEETADNLLDNAKEKADFFGKKSGILTLADDTGLFVDALGGEPGIYSHRWHEGSDYDRCVKLLERLKGIPEDRRTARYIGVVAAYNPSINKFWAYEVRVEGLISNEFGNGGGFGYDRIFKVKSAGKYYSELSEEEMTQISHRGIAVKKLFLDKDFLK